MPRRMVADGIARQQRKTPCCGAASFGVKRSFTSEDPTMVKGVLRKGILMLAALCALLAFCEKSDAQGGAIGEKTKDAKKLPGYFNLYWDARAGKLWLEIDK